MRYEGAVYRPPSEAGSLIIQMTIGCARNTCRFCSMYKAKQFRIRPLEDVVEDLRMAREYYRDYLVFARPMICSMLWERRRGFFRKTRG